MSSLNYEFQNALLDDGKLSSHYANDAITGNGNLQPDDTKNLSSIHGKYFQQFLTIPS